MAAAATNLDCRDGLPHPTTGRLRTRCRACVVGRRRGVLRHSSLVSTGSHRRATVHRRRRRLECICGPGGGRRRRRGLRLRADGLHRTGPASLARLAYREGHSTGDNSRHRGRYRVRSCWRRAGHARNAWPGGSRRDRGQPDESAPANAGTRNCDADCRRSSTGAACSSAACRARGSPAVARVRVYLPATTSILRRLVDRGEIGPAPLTAFAVTPGLREWYVDDDVEELEYAATLEAARASLRLLAVDESAAPRRIVLAADVSDEAVTIRDDLDRGVVRVAEAVPYPLVASAHVDDQAAEPAVRAAA